MPLMPGGFYSGERGHRYKQPQDRQEIEQVTGLRQVSHFCRPLPRFSASILWEGAAVRTALWGRSIVSQPQPHAKERI